MQLQPRAVAALCGRYVRALQRDNGGQQGLGLRATVGMWEFKQLLGVSLRGHSSPIVLFVPPAATNFFKLSL